MENEQVHSSGQNQRLDTPNFSTSLEPSALRELLGLSSERSYEASIFVAIDFGNYQSLKDGLGLNKDSEVGLALLDIDGFETLSIPPSELISTYNFISGSTDYQDRASRKFLFGKSAAITQKSMLSNIEALIPLNRRIVLVGHDIQNELRALQQLAFNFSTYNITILDALRLAETQLGGHLGLRRLLRRLGCPAMELHCSGNDPNFTLRATILLAIQGTPKKSRTGERLARLTELALSPPPIYFQLRGTIESLSVCKDDRTVVAMKKAKKLKKRIKLMENLWGIGKRRKPISLHDIR